MSQRVQEFGAEHTVLKQGVVLEYLRAYLTAMKDKGFKLSYIDAFAGSGWRRSGADSAEVSLLLEENQAEMGCALSVLKIKEPRFDRYVLGDLMRHNVVSLKGAYESARQSGEDVPPVEAVTFFRGDANQLVERECLRLKDKPMDRAVMFLDPYGMQVSWRTLERISESGKIDLWLLIPTGMALARVMPRHGEVPPGWRKALDRFFGGSEWQADLFKETEPDLFGFKNNIREASLQDINNYVLKRLKSLFGPGVHPRGLQLNISGQNAYLLSFVCSNKNPVAYNLALKISDYIIKKAAKL